MEKVIFMIWPVSNDMCRIEASDCRQEVRNLADGGCICSLEVMLGEMKAISDNAEKLGYRAVFQLA